MKRSIRMAALLVIGFLALTGCRCGKSASDPDTAVVQGETKTPAEKEQVILAPTGEVLWGPLTLSDPARVAIGLSVAAGPAGSAVVWIEQMDPGADVYLAMVGEEPGGDVHRVTRHTSSYPPTAVVHTEEGFVLAWGDDRYRHIEIFVARVTQEGRIAQAPRRLTVTTVSEDAPGGVLAVDSSQGPTLATLDDQLVAVWGGPGQGGRQQAYMTTLSTTGKPRGTPLVLTKGKTDASGMQLTSHRRGALLTYCVQGTRGSEMFRMDLTGKPPVASSAVSLGVSEYVPCAVDHATDQDEVVVLWARREQVTPGVMEDTLVVRSLGASGKLASKETQLPGVRLVKFPGKHRAPFDVLALGAGRLAVSWVHRGYDGSRQLRVQVYTTSGTPLTEPVVVPTWSHPADPHLVDGDRDGEVLLVFLDRPQSMEKMQVRAALLEIR